MAEESNYCGTRTSKHLLFGSMKLKRFWQIAAVLEKSLCLSATRYQLLFSCGKDTEVFNWLGSTLGIALWRGWSTFYFQSLKISPTASVPKSFCWCGWPSFHFLGKCPASFIGCLDDHEQDLGVSLNWGEMQWISSSNNKDSPIDRHFRKRRSWINMCKDRKRARKLDGKILK